MPVPFAVVKASVSGRRMRFSGARQTTTDKDGLFLMKSIPQRKVAIVAMNEDATTETYKVDLNSVTKKDDIQLVLEVDGVIAGVVVDGSGEPLEGIQVSAWPDFLSGEKVDRSDWALRGFSAESTDAGGRFKIKGLKLSLIHI